MFESLHISFELVQIFAPKPFETFNQINLKRAIILLVIILFTIFLSFCFIPAETFAEYAGSIYAFFSGIAVSITIIVLYTHTPNVFALITDLKSGIEMRQDNPASTAIYEEWNESIEKFCSLITLSCRWTAHIAMATNFVMAMLAYFTTGLDDYDYNFMYPLWFPFKKSLYEYAFESVIEYVGGYYMLVIVAAGMNFTVTTILTTMAYVKDLRAELANLNATDMSEENVMEMRKRIPGFIQLNIHAIQCVSSFVDIYGIQFAMVFSWSLIAICAALLGVKIELSKEDPDYNVLFYLIVYLIYSYGIILFYCEFGEQVFNAFELFHDDAYQFNWYLLPKDLQRTWHIILVSSQQPIQLVGFGNIICSRETFKWITNSSFSYFMIFRKF